MRNLLKVLSASPKLHHRISLCYKLVVVVRGDADLPSSALEAARRCRLGPSTGARALADEFILVCLGLSWFWNLMSLVLRNPSVLGNPECCHPTSRQSRCSRGSAGPRVCMGRKNVSCLQLLQLCWEVQNIAWPRWFSSA